MVDPTGLLNIAESMMTDTATNYALGGTGELAGEAPPPPEPSVPQSTFDSQYDAPPVTYGYSFNYSSNSEKSGYNFANSSVDFAKSIFKAGWDLGGFSTYLDIASTARNGSVPTAGQVASWALNIGMGVGVLAEAKSVFGAAKGVIAGEAMQEAAASFTGAAYEKTVPKYFSRMVTEQQAIALRNGKTVNLAGKNGMGFIGDASELKRITTSRGMKNAMAVRYDPDYLLEFQLKDTTGLRNLLEYDDPLWRIGGKTLNGYSEFNMPGLTSNNIFDWTLRALKK